MSLFCGCGGFDLGFIQAGFKSVGAFDIDPVAVETHRLNLDCGAVVQDLRSEWDFLSALGGTDVVIAGTPCQGFSTAGKRRFDDPRNHLLIIAGEIALRIKPKIFIAENVRGVISGQHKQYWERLDALFRSNGYKTRDLLLNSEQIGLAQTRKRMVKVAWATLKEWKPIDFMKTGRDLKDALDNIENAPNHEIRLLHPKSELAVIAKKIKPGQKLSNVRGGPRSVHTWDIPEVYGEITNSERRVLEIVLRLRRRLRLRPIGDADPVLALDITKEMGRSSRREIASLLRKGYIRRMEHRYDLTNAFNGKFRRLRWDKPSPTVDTRFTNPRYFLHPDEIRGFTIREAARIQGFPDSFLFTGKEKDQCCLIGNAVPPPLGKWLAESVKRLL